MTSECCGSFHLVRKVVDIHVGDGIVRCVIIRIFFTMVILDLSGCCYSLLTEGNFISSSTTRHNLRLKVNLVCKDNI
jgi:hypothetical protein